MKEGDFVRHKSGYGHGVLVGNGKVFVSNSRWEAVVSWDREIIDPIRQPTDKEWARYCAWRLTQ